MLRENYLIDAESEGGRRVFHTRPWGRMIFVSLLCTIVLLPAHAYSQLAKGKAKFLGCSIGGFVPTSFATYWNQVTPENAGKWGSVEGVMDSYNWPPLDGIYDYARNNSFRYRHHNLIWGQQEPSWITSVDSATQRAQVEEWISLVGARYISMSFIDVVNEPLHAPPSYMNAIGGSGVTGWDWVIQAFIWARQYCAHGVKLTLNDYNILQSSTATDNFLSVIDTLQVRNLIDAIGIQGHSFELKGFQPGILKSNLDRLTATGLPVYITEFDINDANDSSQLANYQTYFPIFWEDPGVSGITFWGYIQGTTWQTNAYLVRNDGSERPALQWLRHYLALPIRPGLVSPLGTAGVPRNANLVWRASASALLYRVQVSANRLFDPVARDTTVSDTTFQVVPLDANTLYYWRVSAINDSGASAYSDMGYFTTGDQIVAVKESERTPTTYELSQNFPNPFNPETVIKYQIPKASHVTLTVYDVLGHEVAVLVNGFRGAGEYSLTFDGTGLASGVYFYRLHAGDFVAARKLVIVK